MVKELPLSLAHGSVCLINTPSTFLADERVIPSLGLVKVAASLEGKGVPVDVLDLAGIANYTEVAGRYMELYKNTRIFGLTATSPQLPAAANIVEEIRSRNPEAKVMVGGSHVTMSHASFKNEVASIQLQRMENHLKPLGEDELDLTGRGAKHLGQLKEMFDVSVAGDGEKAVFKALEESCPKVIDADSIKSPLFLRSGELEKHPYPARHLYDLNSYKFFVDGVLAHAVIGQLGCPFGCEFCGGRDSHAFRVPRFREPSDIVEEIAYVYKTYRRRGIMFYDDELNIKEDKLMELLEGLIKFQETEKIEMRFRGFVKAELFNQKQADLMYRAGFRMILSGVESGSEEILMTINKHTTREINSNFVKYCHRAGEGMGAKALISNGHPGDRKETLFDTLEWVVSDLVPNLDDVDITNMALYPGSKYFDKSKPHPTQNGVWVYEGRNGKLLFSEDVDFAKKANYYKGVPGEYESNVWTEYLSTHQLVYYRDFMEKVARQHLNLPPIQPVAAVAYRFNSDGGLPPHILRRSLPLAA